MIPISFGGTGPESANVKNTPTITAAANITRPECAIPPTTASLALWVGTPDQYRRLERVADTCPVRRARSGLHL
jgi:hypothetical protein